MSTVVLEAAARSETGKGVNRRLRSAGMVPAVVYGSGTEDVLNVALKPIDVVRILKSEMGANTLATLQVDGKEGPKVLIKDYQIHPVKRTLLHVDLLAVKDDQPVRVLVPVNYLGQSPLEKMGAKRRVLSRDVLVSCLPGDIPTAISYSMEGITKPVVVYASELELPETAVPAYKRDFAVVSVRARGGGAAAMSADEDGEEAEAAE